MSISISINIKLSHSKAWLLFFFFFLTEKQIMMQDLEAHLPILEEMITLSQNLIVSFMKNEQSSYIRQARPHI